MKHRLYINFLITEEEYKLLEKFETNKMLGISYIPGLAAIFLAEVMKKRPESIKVEAIKED